MEQTVQTGALLDALKTVQPAVSTRATLPILTCVRLEASNGCLSVQATDLEAAIKVRAVSEQANKGSSEIANDGRIASAVVPAKCLTKAVKSNKGGRVTLEFQHDPGGKSRLAVKGARRTIELETMPDGDWPAIGSGIAWTPIFGASADVLADAFAKVALCASTDDARPVLTSVQMNFDRSSRTAELVATDSYRLGIATLPVEPVGDAESGTILVPSRALKALARQLKGREGQVVLYRNIKDDEAGSRLLIQFGFGDVCWVVRQIEGEFPNWKAIVPEPSGATFQFDSKELASAVQIAADLRSQGSVPVRLVLDEPCSLQLVEQGVATITEELAGADFSPNGVGPMQVALNPAYLIDGINLIGASRAEMRVESPVKPVLLTGDSSGRYVLMPVRLPA